MRSGLLIVHVAVQTSRATHARPAHCPSAAACTFRSVLAFQNFILLMIVIFAVQFVDRSFGPILPLYLEQIGVAHERVPLVAGILFSIMAFAGAGGHHICGRLLARHSTRLVISGGAAAAGVGSVLMGALRRMPGSWVWRRRSSGSGSGWR